MLNTWMEMREHSEDHIEVLLITEFTDKDGELETLAVNNMVDATSKEQAEHYVTYYEEQGVKVKRVTYEAYTG
ncbi:hypothetical protein [Bacillus thuringiensis]|uniref:hypothetical protein n=1 Tax=Bacillus thuringiensis TaxID=1428 RepID=UPI000BFB283D|nr:hypothetical protein [Bacillus thuringiensis]PGT89877.1 hypothetical protein COD17_09000 [Bacillus thuringiensis]